MSTNLSRIWNNSIINIITKKELLQILSDTESYNIERIESTGKMDNPVRRYTLFRIAHQGVTRIVYQIISTKSCRICRLMINFDCRLPTFERIVTSFLNPSWQWRNSVLKRGMYWLQKCKFQYPPRVIVFVFGCASTFGRAQQQRQKKRYSPKDSSPTFTPLMPCLDTSIDDLDRSLIRKEVLPRQWQRMFSMKTNGILRINSFS